MRYFLNQDQVSGSSYNLFFSCVPHTYLNVSNETNKIDAEKNNFKANPPTTSYFWAHIFSHLLLTGEHHQCKNVLQDYPCGLNPISNKKQTSLLKTTTLNSTTCKSLFRVSRSSYNFFFSSPRILSPTAHWGTSSMQKSYHSLTRPTSTSSTPPSSNNFSLIIAKWLHTL